MNKLALLVKDEEGMSLVELLAVIVILSIVAAIGGVAISGVIQRSREDARVADIQVLFDAASLAEASDSFISKAAAATTPTLVTAKKLADEGYTTTVGFLKDTTGQDTSDNVQFDLAVSTGSAKISSVTMKVPVGSTYAGKKANKLLDFVNEAKIKSLDRTILFD